MEVIVKFMNISEEEYNKQKETLQCLIDFGFDCYECLYEENALKDKIYQRIIDFADNIKTNKEQVSTYISGKI